MATEIALNKTALDVIGEGDRVEGCLVNITCWPLRPVIRFKIIETSGCSS